MPNRLRRRPRAAKPPPLRETLRRRLADSGRIAVVGIGSELRGDDAVGALVARKLAAARKGLPAERFRVFDAGTVPENLTGAVARFLTGGGAGAARPHLVLVDAAELGAPPGAIRLLAAEEIGGLSCSTHSLPLSVLAAYLVERAGCDVTVVAVQPRSVGFGAPVSPEAAKAVRSVALALRAVGGGRAASGSARANGDCSASR